MSATQEPLLYNFPQPSNEWIVNNVVESIHKVLGSLENLSVDLIGEEEAQIGEFQNSLSVYISQVDFDQIQKPKDLINALIIADLFTDIDLLWEMHEATLTEFMTRLIGVDSYLYAYLKQTMEALEAGYDDLSQEVISSFSQGHPVGSGMSDILGIRKIAQKQLEAPPDKQPEVPEDTEILGKTGVELTVTDTNIFRAHMSRHEQGDKHITMQRNEGIRRSINRISLKSLDLDRLSRYVWEEVGFDVPAVFWSYVGEITFRERESGFYKTWAPQFLEGMRPLFRFLVKEMESEFPEEETLDSTEFEDLYAAVMLAYSDYMVSYLNPLANFIKDVSIQYGLNDLASNVAVTTPARAIQLFMGVNAMIRENSTAQES